MNMDKYFNIDNEKPLDSLIESGGGMCSVFRTIGCVGDSLSSGEFECINGEGIKTYLDLYDYSWGQFMARATGSKVYNFSKGGMSAKAFMCGFGAECGAWKSENLCQAYIIALGVNDITHALNGAKLGTKDDIKAANDSFVAQYSAIINQLKRQQPNAKFFLVTIPNSGQDADRAALEDKHAELIYDIAAAFMNCYVIDLRKYAPTYDADFRKKFYLRGHMNPMGYLFTSQMMISYIDYIIRHNMNDFKQAGLIGTQFYKENIDG